MVKVNENSILRINQRLSKKHKDKKNMNDSKSVGKTRFPFKNSLNTSLNISMDKSTLNADSLALK